MEHYTLHFDGSCWPNPGGTAGYGYILSHKDLVLDSGHGVIGVGIGMTNNVAEFVALWKGLQSALSHIPVEKGAYLSVLGDSNLVIQIMNRKWRARPDRPFYPAYMWADECAKSLRKRGVTVSFDWVPRARNQSCDDLSKAHNKEAA